MADLIKSYWSGGGRSSGGKKVSFDSRIFKPFSDQKREEPEAERSKAIAIANRPFTFFRPYFFKKPRFQLSNNPISISSFPTMLPQI